MYKSDGKSWRKEKTIKAHALLLRLDESDFTGNVTFSFKRGQGLMAYKTEKHGRFEKNVDNKD